jgi:hypothetical protein
MTRLCYPYAIRAAQAVAVLSPSRQLLSGTVKDLDRRLHRGTERLGGSDRARHGSARRMRQVSLRRGPRGKP